MPLKWVCVNAVNVALTHDSTCFNKILSTSTVNFNNFAVHFAAMCMTQIAPEEGEGYLPCTSSSRTATHSALSPAILTVSSPQISQAF